MSDTPKLNTDEIYEHLEKVRAEAPLIQSITNFVTVNDVANVTLAIGARPCMAENPVEIEDITNITDGLNLNLGNTNAFDAMEIAIKVANKNDIPVVVDPVGVGIGKFRMDFTNKLINDYKVSAVKGNASELNTIILGSFSSSGVDVSKDDVITEDNLVRKATDYKEYALRKKTAVLVTGAIDIVTDGKNTIAVRNGDEMMDKITGSGCMLSSVLCSFITANTDLFKSCVSAAVVFSIAGQKAAQSIQNDEGIGTFKVRFMDYLYNITLEDIKKYADFTYLEV